MNKKLSRVQLESVKRIQQLIDTECGGKQQVFADKTGIGKSSVSHYTNRSHAPGNQHAYLIAKAFNVNPMWVMGFDVPIEKPIAERDLSDESAELMGLRVTDKRLTPRIYKYFQLAEPDKQIVLELIDRLPPAEARASTE